MKTWKTRGLAFAFNGFTAAAVLGLGLRPIGPSWSQDRTPAKPSTDVETLVQGNNEFAFDLYARLAKKEGNIVFSPYSISSALAMTYGGARGDVAEKMAKVLHFRLPPARFHSAFGQLALDLQKDDQARPYQLNVANTLWGQQGYPFLPEFVELTRKDYRAGLREVDFLRASEEARQTINRWVEEQTKDKIKELLPVGVLDSDTRLVLTNAIYMKATWALPFAKKKTAEEMFEAATTTKVSVAMMRQSLHRHRYYSGEGFQWLELPYKGDRLSMVLLLPQQKGQLAELEKKLSPTFLRNGINNLQSQVGQVALPRFKMALQLPLLDELKRMGMQPSPFTHIASGENLGITAVMHKAYIDVDEVGTEAAAATAVVMGKKGGFVPFTFRADHPFLFLIRDMQTDSILFFGRVSDPSKR